MVILILFNTEMLEILKTNILIFKMQLPHTRILNELLTN